MPRATRGLTYEEVIRFHDQGYLIVEDLFTDGDLQPVIDEIGREITKRAQTLVDEGILTSTHEDLGFERQLIGIDRESKSFVPAMSGGVLSGPAIFDLITLQKLLDVAESLCGHELIASSVYRLRPKLPNDPRGEVPWHQDSGYLDPYCDGSLVLTVWIPLLEATVENGCLHVLPGAHRGPVLPHKSNDAGIYLQIPREELPSQHQPVPTPVRKGSAVLFTNRTPHVSFENTRDVVRWSMDLRYQSATLPTNAPISRTSLELERLGAGTVPPACYPPAADFLVRSRLRPQEVVTDPDVFHRMRTEHKARFDAAAATAGASGRDINPFSMGRWQRD